MGDTQSEWDECRENISTKKHWKNANDGNGKMMLQHKKKKRSQTPIVIVAIENANIQKKTSHLHEFRTKKAIQAENKLNV